jgi:membrane-associated phospholipid phosphatase
MLTASPGDTRFEAWLRQHDGRWRAGVRDPSPLLGAALDLAYLACYVIVPLAFVIVWSRGTRDDVDRFWVAVLLSGFACYVTLPWLVSRPPRMFDEAPRSRAGVASFNTSLLRHVSHQLNTFPSGHVAVATAVALTMSSLSTAAGVIFGVVAAGIAAGAAIGRYHYGVDVLLGIVVGLIAALAA